MAFLRGAKPVRCQNPYRQRLGFDLLPRHVRKLQDRSPSAYCSRGYESHCGLRIAKPPQSKVTKHCQPGTSRTTNNRKFTLADGLSRVAQCFANILELKVGMSSQDLSVRPAFAYHADHGGDRYTQAPDAREAAHLVGIYGDACEGFHFYLRLDGRRISTSRSVS